MNTSTTRAEAERLLGISEKLLQSRDFTSSRDFAILAQENEPLLEGSDQILAVTDVLLASSKVVNNKHHDWYAILQIPPKSDDVDLIKKQYRRLALLLHPDKNKYAFADHAFKFVADAWAVLSDSSKKVIYDNELSLFSKVNLVPTSNNNNSRKSGTMSNVSSFNNVGKMPVRRSVREKNNQWRTPPSANDGNKSNNVNVNEKQSIWTACPYCFVLYEYPKIYEECCLKCQSCSRGFHAAAIKEMPPLVPGKEAYYTCWGFFPLGFSSSDNGSGKGFPNWMPNMFGGNGNQADGQAKGAANGVRVNVVEVPVPAPAPAPQSTPVGQPIRREVPQAQSVAASASQKVADSGTVKKRGRPRKYPL